MTELEHTLAQERDLNDTLSRNLEESRGHAADQTNNITLQLQDAEDEIERLQRALKDTDSKLKVG